MKVGDMIQRKKIDIFPDDKMGIVISLQQQGYPPHPCATVLYPETGREYAIAVSKIEVISESR